MSNFIVCSYYTLNTPYQQVAHDFLMRSLEGKDIHTDIRGVANRGSWQANTSYKPRFLAQMLVKYPEHNLVFLDADAEVIEHPHLFSDIPSEYDLAVHLLDRNAWYNRVGAEDKELLSGTLFLRNSLKTRGLVDRWATRCEEYPTVWEQRILQELLAEEQITFYELPLSYCYIRTLPDGTQPHVRCDRPIIVHNQVSRSLKGTV